MKRYLLPMLAMAMTVTASRAATNTAAEPASTPSNLESLALYMDSLTPEPTTDLTLASSNQELPGPLVEPSFAAIYHQAVKAHRLAVLKQRRLALLRARAARDAILAEEKSLVEREEAQIEAACATPESSPATCPFSLERPEAIVSAEGSDTTFNAITQAINVDDSRLAPTPEPATWALFGIGGTLLTLVARRASKTQPVLVPVKK